MVKLIGLHSIYFIGKLEEIKLQLAAIENQNMTVLEYIKQQIQINKSGLN